MAHVMIATFLLLAALYIQESTQFLPAECKPNKFVTPKCKSPHFVRLGKGNGKTCIFVSNVNKSFGEAEGFCKKHGSALVELKNKKVHHELVCLVRRETKFDTRIWLGAKRDSAGEYNWLSGPKFNGTWAHGQPDFFLKQERCMEMGYAGMGLLNDAKCSIKKRVVCEMPWTH